MNRVIVGTMMSLDGLINGRTGRVGGPYPVLEEKQPVFVDKQNEKTVFL
jgi:hypothetical protein